MICKAGTAVQRIEMSVSCSRPSQQISSFRRSNPITGGAFSD